MTATPQLVTLSSISFTSFQTPAFDLLLLSLMRRFRYLWLTAMLVGCDAPAPSVEGRVTLDGKPLETGFITLYPEGTGSTLGAEVRSGEFRIEKVAVGPAKLVVSTPPVAAQQVKKGNASALKFETPIQPVTASMQGNGVPVRIQAGHQSVEIALRTASVKKPR